MNANFLCPHCRTFLNVGEQIILSAKNKDGKRGLLLFSLHLGDYDINKHSSFELEENEIVKLYCPACHKSLRAKEVHENICKVLMQDEEDQEFAILFSGVYGEKCTYRICENKIESFGEHAMQYLDLESLSRLI